MSRPTDGLRFLPRRWSRRRWLTTAASAVLSCGTLPADDATSSPSRDNRDLVTPEADAAVAAGLAWLASRQHPDRAFGPLTSFNRYRRNPAVNALCGLALLASGSTPGRGPYGPQLDHCLDLLLEFTGPTGYIAEPGADYDLSPMYGHGFATTFLAEACGTTLRDDVQPALEQAVRLIVDTQNREGGWRYQPEPRESDISVTVCQMMALRAAHNTGVAVPRTTIDRAVAYLTRCQNPDGGFRYQSLVGGESEFPRSAAAVTALYTSGVTEGPVLEAGLRYLQQFRPGAPRAQDRGYYFYAQYYAVQAAWHAGGDVWRNWYPAQRDELLRQQLSAGHWVDQTISAEYATAMALLVLQLPDNYLPIFQR